LIVIIVCFFWKNKKNCLHFIPKRNKSSSSVAILASWIDMSYGREAWMDGWMDGWMDDEDRLFLHWLLLAFCVGFFIYTNIYLSRD